MARPAGIEPATAGLEGRCSIRLSYGRLIKQRLSAKRILSGRCRVRANRIGSARGLYRTFRDFEAPITAGLLNCCQDWPTCKFSITSQAPAQPRHSGPMYGPPVDIRWPHRVRGRSVGGWIASLTLFAVGFQQNFFSAQIHAVNRSDLEQRFEGQQRIGMPTAKRELVNTRFSIVTTPLINPM